METKFTIEDFFANPWKDCGRRYVSTYVAGLRDARILTGRHIRSGKKLKKHHGSWLGTLGYMVVIDLLSEIIDNPIANLPNKYNNNFVKFLKNFLKLSHDDACSLYALRCAFAHNFGLKNIPKSSNRNSELKKEFVVIQGTNTLIKKEKNKYIVDLEKFADLIEEFHKEIKKNPSKIELNISNELFLLIP